MHTFFANHSIAQHFLLKKQINKIKYQKVNADVICFYVCLKFYKTIR